MKFVTTRYQDMQCEPHKKRGREGKKDLVRHWDRQRPV